MATPSAAIADDPEKAFEYTIKADTVAVVSDGKGIAATVADEELREEYIIPSVFNREVSQEVARAVAEEAERAGDVREPTTVM